MEGKRGRPVIHNASLDINMKEILNEAKVDSFPEIFSQKDFS